MAMPPSPPPPRRPPSASEPVLPPDPDVDVPGASPARPMHLQGRYVALVAAGGAAGAATREALVLAVPAEGFDTVVLVINLVGAFALGLLLERLLLAGPDRGRRRAARLLLGTGVLGGFTTYSTLALDTVHLLQRGEVGMAIAYGLANVLLGAVASVAGIRCGATLGRRRPA